MSFALPYGMAKRFFQFSTFPLRRPEQNNLWGFGQIITQCLQTPVNCSVKWGLKWYLMGSLWGSNDTFHAKRSAWEIGLDRLLLSRWFSTRAKSTDSSVTRLSLDPALTVHWWCNLWQVTQLPCSSVSLTVKCGKDDHLPCKVIVTTARHKVRTV